MIIHVIRNARHFGTLNETSDGTILFVYQSDIHPNEYLSGLDKPHNESASGLFPVFENLLPEMGVLELLRREHRITRTIDLLLHLGDIHGSFRFCSDADLAQTLAESLSGYFLYDDAKAALLGDYTFPNILHDVTLDVKANDLFPTGLPSSKIMGLSGYQYKFSVAFDPQNRTVRKIDTGDGDYFMKPYNKAYTRFTPTKGDALYAPYLLLNEHLFMSFAKSLGFSVPYNAIIQDGSEFHYLIKRYDRYNGAKIDHCEFLTLMGKHSSQKYKVTLKAAVDTVLPKIGDQERVELFRFLLFSIVIAHGDLHAKNLSLIYRSNAPDERRMQLAPYYDISTTGIYSGLDRKDIGLKLQNKVSNISRKDLLWLAHRMQLDCEVAKAHIDQIAEAFMNDFLPFVRRLPHSVRSLPMRVNRYTDESFEAVLIRYHRKRTEYINRKLLETPLRQKEIWS